MMEIAKTEQREDEVEKKESSKTADFNTSFYISMPLATRWQ
jgi:hypothetical protein